MSHGSHSPLFQNIPPQCGLAGVAKTIQIRGDFLFTRLADAFLFQLFFVGWHVGEGQASHPPAGPRAPRAQLRPGTGHPGGEMLPMPSRISQKVLRGMVLEKPSHGRIGKRPLLQDRFIPLQIRPHGPIQKQNRPRGKTLQPKALRVFQCSEIKARSPVVAGSSRARHTSRGEQRVGKRKKRARDHRRSGGSRSSKAGTGIFHLGQMVTLSRTGGFGAGSVPVFAFQGRYS